MKFAFDVDGVITEMPQFFGAVTAALRAAGHEVVILTDFDEHFRSYREHELEQYGIEYDELVITPNKETFCRENGVEFAIDGDADYYPSSQHLCVFAVKIRP